MVFSGTTTVLFSLMLSWPMTKTRDQPFQLVMNVILQLCLETLLNDSDDALFSINACLRYPYDKAAMVAISTVKEFSDGIKEVYVTF